MSTEKGSAAFDPPDPKQRKKFVEENLKNKKMSYEQLSEFPSFETLTKKVEAAYRHLLIKQKEFGFFSPTCVYIDAGQKDLFEIRYDKSGANIVKRGEEKSLLYVLRWIPGYLTLFLIEKRIGIMQKLVLI